MSPVSYVSAHDETLTLLFTPVSFGDGQRNWVGQMQHFSDTFWITSSTERLLKQPSLFTVGNITKGDALHGDKGDNEQAAM